MPAKNVVPPSFFGHADGLEPDAHDPDQAQTLQKEAGYGDKFRHRLGHGIGWDVYEPPFLTKTDKTIVKEGMIFTIEPSIFQDGGVSARVEDCIVTRPGGGEALTSGFQDLIVIG